MREDVSLWQARLGFVAIVLTVVAVGSVAADPEQSVVCDVGIFKALMNITLQTILVGYIPIGAVGLAGERLTSAIPFLPQSYRKKIIKWRNAVLIGAAGLYIGLPVGHQIALNAGFPVPSCVNFVPF